MEQQIIFTLKDVIEVCSGITVIAAAVAVLWKLRKQIKQPDEEQNAKIKKCEERLDDHDRKFEDYNRYLANDKLRIDKIEKDNRASNKVIIKTLKALTEHALNGNNVKPLEEANADLDEFLLDK